MFPNGPALRGESAPRCEKRRLVCALHGGYLEGDRYTKRCPRSQSNGLTPEGELRVQQGSRRRLESGATLRARADVDADDGFTVALHGVEAVLAKRQGKLVFALGVKTAVTLRTSRK